MTQTNTPNNSIVNVNPLQGEDNPAVLAYRVGQLEKSSREGFKALFDKLDQMSNTYATHKDIKAAKDQAELEHKAIREEIEDVRREVGGMRHKSWIQNTLSAVLGVVLALLTTYAINDILH